MALVRKCPVCDTSHPDEGQYLIKCSNYGTCGYCRHATITNNICSDCGTASPTPLEIDDSVSRAVEE